MPKKVYVTYNQVSLTEFDSSDAFVVPRRSTRTQLLMPQRDRCSRAFTKQFFIGAQAVPKVSGEDPE